MSLTTISPPPRGDRLPAAGGPVLWLVRHGQSTWNALGLAQGQSDQPRLTARGARQARDVTNQLPHHIFVNQDFQVVGAN